MVLPSIQKYRTLILLKKLKLKKRTVFFYSAWNENDSRRRHRPGAGPPRASGRADRLSRPHVDRIESAPQIHDHEMRLYFTTVYYEYTRLEKERNRSEGHNTAAEEQQRRV